MVASRPVEGGRPGLAELAPWTVALAPLAVYDGWRIGHGRRSLSNIAGGHTLLTTTAMCLLWLHFFSWRAAPYYRKWRFR